MQHVQVCHRPVSTGNVRQVGANLRCSATKHRQYGFIRSNVQVCSGEMFVFALDPAALFFTRAGLRPESPCISNVSLRAQFVEVCWNRILITGVEKTDRRTKLLILYLKGVCLLG